MRDEGRGRPCPDRAALIVARVRGLLAHGADSALEYVALSLDHVEMLGETATRVARVCWRLG